MNGDIWYFLVINFYVIIWIEYKNDLRKIWVEKKDRGGKREVRGMNVIRVFWEDFFDDLCNEGVYWFIRWNGRGNRLVLVFLFM